MSKEMISGFLLVDKPSGPSSHDIINQLRHITNIKKIGHAGTLDPFASGLLIVAVGRESTKQISKYVKLSKEYIAEIILGTDSNTYDRTGNLCRQNCQKINLTEIKKALSGFQGEQKQIPPMFSAKKIKGQKLYILARKGVEIERKANTIFIHNISLIEFEWPKLKLVINCSSGTYIRSIAHDLGQKLKCGAYLDELKRTKIGNFKIDKSTNIREITKNNWHKLLFN